MTAPPRFLSPHNAPRQQLCIFALIAAALSLLRPCAADAAPARQAAVWFGTGQYHLNAVPVERIVATLTDRYELSNIQACRWLVYAPDAPDTDDQSAAFSTLTSATRSARVDAWSETDPLDTGVLRAVLADGEQRNARASILPRTARYPASLLTVATYSALLMRRQLAPGPPTRPLERLSAEKRIALTSASPTIDYGDPAFQSWLYAHGLRRRAGERDLDFALRVFRSIRAAYRYTYDVAQDRRASAICACAAADCGGLSQLFVAALRANSVPAVALCGRFARSAKQNGGSAASGCVHVKSQFYAEGIGWVPVEMSGAVYDRNAPDLTYFGRSAGDFLTLSVGNDRELRLGNGRSVAQRGMQGIRFWVWGMTDPGQTMGDCGAAAAKMTSRWTVRQLPLDASGAQLASAG